MSAQAEQQNGAFVHIPLNEWNAQQAAIADIHSKINRLIMIYDRPLTIKETAARLQIARPTLYNYVREGKIKATRTDKKLLFLPDDIAEYLQKNKA